MKRVNYVASMITHPRRERVVSTVSIHFIDHVLQLCLGGVLPQGPHHRPQLLGGDGAVAILVEQGERLLELYTTTHKHSK